MNFENSVKFVCVSYFYEIYNNGDWKELEKSYWEEVTDIQYFNVEMEDKNGNKYSVTTNSPESKSINILCVCKWIIM